MKMILKKYKLVGLLFVVLFLSACEMGNQFNMNQDSTNQTMDTEMAMEQAPSENTTTRQQADRDVIYTATVSYQTVNYEPAKQSIIDIIEGTEGFIQYQDESVNEYSFSESNTTLTSLYMIIRVPQDNYEAILEQFEANDQAQLMQLSRGSQDVSQQVQDIEIRIESVENRIDRLNELNDQAESITDLIEIQTALETAISERDLLLADQAAIADQIDYATINLSIEEVIELSDRSDSQLTFWDRILMAFEDTWKNSIDAFEWGVLTVIFLVPYIIVILIIILIIRYIIRPLVNKLSNTLGRNKKRKNETITTRPNNSKQNNNNTEE